MSTARFKAPRVTSNLEVWLDNHCMGDGFDSNPLLAKSTGSFESRWVAMSGAILNNKGIHSESAFSRSLD